MKIAVLANDDQWEEINRETSDAEFTRMDSFVNIPADAAAYLFLQHEGAVDFTIRSKPILINSVCITLKEMNAPANVVRINGWKSFLSRSTWEVSGTINEAIHQVFVALKKSIIPVPDEPGFVSARVIAMIINEAYFTFEDKISTREEIDIAMKLGTNYPYGPFKWASYIGKNNIYLLLKRLSMDDNRYLPATSLKEEATA